MKNGKLDGKAAVVTASSKGIRAEIAKQFAAEGASVVAFTPAEAFIRRQWKFIAE